MQIRRAQVKDIPAIMKLLSQVLEIHASTRPDIFIPGTTKYTVEELTQSLTMTRKQFLSRLTKMIKCSAMHSRSCKSSLFQPIWFSLSHSLSMTSVLTAPSAPKAWAGPCLIMSKLKPKDWDAMK
jgi:hypothetical protein